MKNSDHFGFICREQNAENFIGYVFKCQSESFADDVVGGEFFQDHLSFRKPKISDGWVMKLIPLSLFSISTAITQAFQATSEAYKKEKQPVLSCEHCPMVWFHKLCSELEGKELRRQSNIYLNLLSLESDHDFMLSRY